MKNYISTKDLPREKWLALRREGIGSSDVGAILGLNRWKSPLDVYETKLGLRPEDDDNYAMSFGRKMENTVAEIYSEQTGFKVRRDFKLRIHDEYPFMRCNLDRLVLHPEKGVGVLEIKTVGDWSAQNWEEDVPIPYFCQIQQQLFVSGYQWGVFGIAVGNRELRKLEVVRDEEFIKKQNEVLFKFWHENVEKRVPPAWTAIDIYRIKADPETIIEATDAILPTVKEMLKAKAALKVAEKKYDMLSDEVKLFMLSREYLTVNGDTVATWKQQKNTQFQVGKFKEKYPALYEEFADRTPIRKFLPKLTKETEAESD